MLLSINNLKIRYEVIGEGKPLVLLHGWRGSIDSLHQLGMALSKRFEVYNIELPGFGKSTEPRDIWGVSEYAGFCDQVFQSLEIRRPVLVGHSFGGAIALEYASKFNNIKSLILIGAAVIRESSSKARTITPVAKQLKKIFSLPFLAFFEDYARKGLYMVLRENDYVKVSPHMRKIMEKVLKEDLSHKLPSIDADTMLIWGSEDQSTPVRQAKEIQEKIPEAELEIVERYGHNLPLIAPEVVGKLIIKKFYKDV